MTALLKASASIGGRWHDSVHQIRGRSFKKDADSSSLGKALEGHAQDTGENIGRRGSKRKNRSLDDGDRVRREAVKEGRFLRLHPQKKKARLTSQK